MNDKKIKDFLGEDFIKTINDAIIRIPYISNTDEIDWAITILFEILGGIPKNIERSLSGYLQRIIKLERGSTDTLEIDFTYYFITNIVEYKEKLEGINRLKENNNRLENIEINEDKTDIEFTIKG
jgi:hypothetical protein